MTITDKNDELRKCLPLLPYPHRFVITRLVSSLPYECLQGLLNKVISFNDFNFHNDPYGEHDFGTIKLDGKNFFWKIDYYDHNFKYFKRNGNCVITLMRSNEY